MKHFGVVQKSGILGDKLISIDVPEESDIKQIIQHSLKPIRDELKQINESMECLREEIMNTKSDIRKSERDIQILKKNIADSAQQHRFLSAELKQRLEAFQQKNQTIVESHQRQNLKAMDDLKKNFSSEFKKFCRDDIWGYFDMLKKYTEKVSGDAEKINSNIATLRSVQEAGERKINSNIATLRSVQEEAEEKINSDIAALQRLQEAAKENFAATSAIAQFFCDFYKADLKRRAEELSVKSQRIDSLVSKLEQMKKS